MTRSNPLQQPFVNPWAGAGAAAVVVAAVATVVAGFEWFATTGSTDAVSSVRHTNINL